MSSSNNEKWLRNAWYQIAWSEEVQDKKPLARTILGRPLLLYRRDDGRIAALLDRCPHRFAPLSIGTVERDVIRCRYHGLAFDGEGKCADNPHGPTTAAMRVTRYPSVERHDAIWIWMGDPNSADQEKIPDLSFIDKTPETARIRGYMPTRANYQLLTDNIMDLSHTDYLHPESLGGMMTAAKLKTRSEMDGIIAEWKALDCEAPAVFRAALPSEGRADIWIEVRWRAPAVMVLGHAAKLTGVPREKEDESYTLHNMTPENATASHYFYCATRPYRQADTSFTEFLRQAISHAFENEDKPVVEAQQTRIGTDDFWDLKPVLLPVDKAAVLVRRKLESLIAAEEAQVGMIQ